MQIDYHGLSIDGHVSYDPGERPAAHTGGSPASYDVDINEVTLVNPYEFHGTGVVEDYCERQGWPVEVGRMIEQVQTMTRKLVPQVLDFVLDDWSDELHHEMIEAHGDDE